MDPKFKVYFLQYHEVEPPCGPDPVHFSSRSDRQRGSGIENLTQGLPFSHTTLGFFLDCERLHYPQVKLSTHL